MSLQRARVDAGVGQLLRRARRRREPFDVVALALGPLADGRQGRGLPGAGDAFQRQDLIPAREDVRDGRALGVAQLRIRALDVVARRVAAPAPAGSAGPRA